MNFGMYLVDQGAITPKQFTDAVRVLVSRKVPIGQIALRRRKLSLKQVFDILRQQSGNPAPFGRIAVDLGYLSEPVLAELLYYQSEAEEPLPKLLVRQGAITQCDLDKHYSDFQALQAEQASKPVLDAALTGRSQSSSEDFSVM